MSESARYLIQPDRSFNQRMQREYELRFAVHTEATGRAELRYFASPQDFEGVTIAFTPRERVALREALELRGFHAIARDDGPEDQLVFAFGEPLPRVAA